MKFTNTSDGPRGFHSKGGLVMLEKGESWSGDMTDEEAESAKGTGYFDQEGAHRPALTGKNKEALLAIAKDEGAEVPDDATNAQIVAAIEARRAA